MIFVEEKQEYKATSNALVQKGEVFIGAIQPSSVYPRMIFLLHACLTERNP